ncbi:MAG: RecQ family ATP-dependent DNA helicase [Ignavibacteriales bacterium]|nr:MAG: RecQ family ATP-dependent DNA helicase [Ignavibacteriales bacterium]
MTINQTLEKYFGYKTFRPGQEEIINSILAGKNVLGILPTGAGKSLCYQIPALASDNFSIVISPLIALMKDQVDSLNNIEKTAAFINSSLDYIEIENVFNELSQGIIKLLYLSPEKLENQIFTERLKKLNPKFLFIDEAHCISEWGHNFRPSYRRIKDFKKFIDFENVAAFTATATPEVRQDIIDQLELVKPKLYVKGFERSNLELNVIKGKEKREWLLKILSKKSTPAIIYTATRKQTESVSEFLRSNGINSHHYHAGLANEVRRMIQDDFIHDRLPIIVATNAFGMGIDKKDIRTIFHYNIPSSIENYYQEIGRAGRDGKPSKIFLLYDEKDKQIHHFLINSSYPDRDQIETVYQTICDYGRIALGSVSDKPIGIDEKLVTSLKLKDINISLTNSAIKILEEANYLKFESGYNKGYFFRFLITPEQLKKHSSHLSDEIQLDLVLVLLREFGSSSFDKSSRIDLEKISQSLGVYKNEVIKELENLDARGLIDFEKPNLNPAVIVNSPRVKKENLQLNLINLLRQKSHAEKRLEEMVNYAFAKECRFRTIIKYFGEEANNYKCGKCDVCTNTEENSSINDFIEEKIIELLSEIKDGINIKSLVDILKGNSQDAEFLLVEAFASCSHFSSLQIKSAIKDLEQVGQIRKDDQNKYHLFDVELGIELEHHDSTQSDYEPYLKLFNALRAIRKEVSEKFGQPINIVCPDEVLKEIAVKRPTTASELLSIKGFNQRMYNKMGEEILAVIKHRNIEDSESNLLNENKVPDNIKQIFDLVKKRYSLKDISSLTKLPEAVVSMQVESLISLFPDLIIDSLVDHKKSLKIKDAIQSGITNLKELKSSLGSSISYAEIRIILAKELLADSKRF